MKKNKKKKIKQPDIEIPKEDVRIDPEDQGFKETLKNVLEIKTDKIKK